MHIRNSGRPQHAASGCALSAADAAIVKGMLARGDRQSWIAAYFGGINQGRIAEISTGQRFPEVSAADPSKLPEPGLFLSLRDRAELAEAIRDFACVEDGVRDLRQRLQLLLGKRPA
jgi:hypothetical protein